MSFSEKVYSLLKKVPKGKIITYKAIAEALNTKAYRAVGQALKHNPNAPKVPCHRVIRSDGSLGGYQGKNYKKKTRLLQQEGIQIKNNKIKDFKKKYFVF